jgi:hypothetical protein
MEKKSVYHTRDGRTYDMTMSWNETFKDSDHVFPIHFQFVDKSTGRAVVLPREIATFALGGPEDTLTYRIQTDYAGSREAMIGDFTEMAYRRVTDWLERGH